MPYQDVFQFLVDIGVVHVILPFLLVFLIVFSYLQRTKVLGTERKGEPKRRINAMMSFVFGFLTVLTTSQLDAIGIITSYLVLLIVVGLFVALLLGMAGAKLGKPGTVVTGLAVAIFVLTVLYALGQAGVVDPNTVEALFWPIIFVIALTTVIAYIFRKEPETQPARRRETAQAEQAPAEPARRPAPEPAPAEAAVHPVGLPPDLTEDEQRELAAHIIDIARRRQQR